MNELQMIKIFPKFKYHLSSHHHDKHQCIVADGIVFHRVCNFDEFYKALGYSDDIRKGGMTPDEYIWNRFTRDDAPLSEQCLQTQIVSYLQRHSRRFREQFGNEYEDMVGKCLSDRIDDRLHCANCIKHPRFLTDREVAALEAV